MVADTKAPAKPTVVKPEPAVKAPAKASEFHTQIVRIRWHREVSMRLEIVPTLVKWAEGNGHLVQVKDARTGDGKIVRIGGKLAPGSILMTKETREFIKAQNLTADELDRIVREHVAKRAPAVATS